jgi:hypothetical protein
MDRFSVFRLVGSLFGYKLLTGLSAGAREHLKDTQRLLREHSPNCANVSWAGMLMRSKTSGSTHIARDSIVEGQS